jgi:DNA processing protein
MAMDQPELLDWLGLRLIPGVGSVTFCRLVRAMGSPGEVLGADPERLSAFSGVKPELAQAISRRQWSTDPEKELTRLNKLGARVITLEHEEYPPLLREVYAPPPVLYLRGDLAGCRAGGVAVVGSRNFTPYGQRVAREYGRALALAGKSVISGLARGIDTEAHMGALEGGGHTVAVLGCGLDVAYPPENLELAVDIADQGALLSEFPLGTRPAPGNFPVRNRVISGLSQAVLVVEASLRSGALITARHARDQGRDVWAVPGPVGSPTSAGCHHLIKEGAALAGSPQDLLGPGALFPVGLEQPQPRLRSEAPADLPADAAALLGLVGAEPVHADTLVRDSGLAPQEVTALLVNLEMAGLVSQQPGRMYVRN